MQRGRAGKGGSEVGRGYRNLPTSVFALFARGAHGAKNSKSVAALAGRPPACDPARPRSARAGFESEGRRRAVWNRAWAPGLPDMGCDLSAIAGALARVTSGRRVEDGGAFPSRGAATLIGTASPVPLTVDMLTGPLAARLLSMRNGYGAAQHVRRKKGDG